MIKLDKHYRSQNLKMDFNTGDTLPQVRQWTLFLKKYDIFFSIQLGKSFGCLLSEIKSCSFAMISFYYYIRFLKKSPNTSIIKNPSSYFRLWHLICTFHLNVKIQIYIKFVWRMAMDEKMHALILNLGNKELKCFESFLWICI